jgi:hypothetical protein
MKLSVSRTEVWAATIDDRPGGVADKLSALAEAGANLGFILARRTPERRGHGVVFVTPLKGRKQFQAAETAGFQKTETLHALRVETADKPGFGAKLTRAVAQAGVNLRGVSATALGKLCAVYLVTDTAKQLSKVADVLKKLR